MVYKTFYGIFSALDLECKTDTSEKACFFIDKFFSAGILGSVGNDPFYRFNNYCKILQ